MPHKPILVINEPILRFKLAPALPNTQQLGRLIRDMWDTLQYLGPECAGLAANQIGHDSSVCIVKQGSKVLINPKLAHGVGKIASVESCYSLPGYEAVVPRFKKIFVTFQDMTGAPKSIQTEDIRLSVTIQHEVDHLYGIMISDYVEHSNGKSGGVLIKDFDQENPTYLAFAKQVREQDVAKRS